MGKKITKFALVFIALCLTASVGIFGYAIYRNSKIENWAKSIFYGDVKRVENSIRVTTHVKDKKEILPLIVKTTSEMQKSGFLDKYPEYILVVTIKTTDGSDEFQSYDATFTDISKIELGSVKTIDGFINQLSK